MRTSTHYPMSYNTSTFISGCLLHGSVSLFVYLYIASNNKKLFHV